MRLYLRLMKVFKLMTSYYVGMSTHGQSELVYQRISSGRCSKKINTTPTTFMLV